MRVTVTKKTPPLTKAETDWIKKLKKVLAECPTDRLGSYTIGDSDIHLYDKSFDSEICNMQESGQVDHCRAVERLGCDLGMINFPFPVLSTAG